MVSPVTYEQQIKQFLLDHRYLDHEISIQQESCTLFQARSSNTHWMTIRLCSHPDKKMTMTVQDEVIASESSPHKSALPKFHHQLLSHLPATGFCDVYATNYTDSKGVESSAFLKCRNTEAFSPQTDLHALLTKQQLRNFQDFAKLPMPLVDTYHK